MLFTRRALDFHLMLFLFLFYCIFWHLFIAYIIYHVYWYLLLFFYLICIENISIVYTIIFSNEVWFFCTLNNVGWLYYNLSITIDYSPFSIFLYTCKSILIKFGYSIIYVINLYISIFINKSPFSILFF